MAFESMKNKIKAAPTFRLGGMDKTTGKQHPSEITGYYLGPKTVNVQGKDSTVYTFQTEKGDLAIWGGHFDLDKQMAKTKPGFLTRVVYNGKIKTAKGNTMCDYEVFVDANHMIDLGTESSTLQAEEVADDYIEEFHEEVNAEFDAPTTRRPTAPVQAATVPDAARQAKVKALLAKTKTA